jgi:hypothetical protein
MSDEKETAKELKKNKQCFVIAPIGDDHSSTRRWTEGLYKAVISPVLRKLKYDIEIAHKISEAGSITKQIIERLLI